MSERNQGRMRGRNKQDNPRSDASFLYIRYKDDVVSPDTGYRPSGGLAPGTVFYLSPDISVSPVDGFGNVRAGTDVTVKARIFNGGALEAFSAYVEFWWFNPTLAFTAVALNQRIGTKIVNVPGGDSYVDVECPNKWTPIFANGGHECLVVQVSSLSEGGDDLKFPFAAALDRHVGQRNLTVANQPGQKLQLVVGNPFHQTEHFTVRLSTLLVGGDMDEFRTLPVHDLMSLLGNAVVDQRRIDDQRLRLGVTEMTQREPGIRLIRARETRHYGEGQYTDDLGRYLRARARSDPDFNPAALGRSLVEFFLRSDEGRELDFELLPTDMGSDHFVVHHLTQVIAGCDIGGYTIVVPPADFDGRR
jgi:hypothetical protein